MVAVVCPVQTPLSESDIRSEQILDASDYPSHVFTVFTIMNYYESKLSELSDITQESADIQRSFLQHALLVSSSMLGIPVSLHTTTPQCRWLRWVFALAVGILVLGVLANATALYAQTRLADRVVRKYAAEYKAALSEHRQLRPVVVNKTMLHTACERATCILLLSALLLLGFYAVCISLSA